MQKCISLAKKAKGKVEPNPYVGAVVYDEDSDSIISCGYHQKFGSNHAEVNAINNAKGNTKNKTLIVNLEPCSHWGKTPPCADLIIESGIKKVVIAQVDPNPSVNKKGVKKLTDAGIEVISGVLEKEARELNKVFNKNFSTNLPYIMLKTATTLDSKIALENGKSKWITNEKARQAVQKLRSEYQAIMTASGTVLADNPRLDVRIKNKKSPIRIIFDPNNKIPFSCNVFKNDSVRIILINNSKIPCMNNVEQIKFSGNYTLLFKDLYKRGIYSIMVEAGVGFNSILLKNKLVDEINQFVAPKIFGSGINFVQNIEISKIDDAIELDDICIRKIDDNFLINGKIRK